MISDETLYKIYQEIGLPPLMEPVSLDENDDEMIAVEFAVVKKRRAMRHLRGALVEFDETKAA
jgi:hypothetical protein